ncbi:hypothetical protein IRJ41_004716 [Triplophysa rosa]|uniref:Ig-like domain-containing protein n=2 Tax=Triplophysa rosa TaxID=992332 RepID=A0A9W7WYU0_TRIRA|nr:hypothetical protein IRJ41_004716 [Triplophysa rosa]
MLIYVFARVLLHVLLFSQKIYGAEIEMKVRPGDNITLYCDRPITHGFIVWIRNCSHEHQPSLILDYKTMFQETFRRFSFPRNSSVNSFDLHITNITVSDLGLYYCAELERKVNNEIGILYSTDLYYYGNRTTRVSLAVTLSSGPFTTVFPPLVSDCFLCWTLLFSVCPVCVLFCSICVYCLCKKTDQGTEDKGKTKSRNTFEGGDDDEVCYASLDVTTRRQKRIMKKQLQSSDFSTYAAVRTDIVKNTFLQ